MYISISRSILTDPLKIIKPLNSSFWFQILLMLLHSSCTNNCDYSIILFCIHNMLWYCTFVNVIHIQKIVSSSQTKYPSFAAMETGKKVSLDQRSYIPSRNLLRIRSQRNWSRRWEALWCSRKIMFLSNCYGREGDSWWKWPGCTIKKKPDRIKFR